MNQIYDKFQILIQERNTALCVGLDPDITKIPSHLPKNISGVKQFLLEVIDATKNHCIAYKPNISFFEAMGIQGLQLLLEIKKEIPKNIPIIIDGKRGDIGNTSYMQAKFIFDELQADATTLHPYMGLDSLSPFFEYKDKYNFVLALTSNPSAIDFEKQKLISEQPLYNLVAQKCSIWNQKYNNIGLVVGATQNEINEVREIDRNMIFLVPGVGTQGGSYLNAYNQAKNKNLIAIINVSRSILYCSKEKDFANKINMEIKKYALT